MCTAKHIIVNCKINDAVDVRCGGPKVLGYDFYVDPDDEIGIIEFIKKKLKRYGRPLLSIKSHDNEVRKSHLWTKSMIEKCIMENEM